MPGVPRECHLQVGAIDGQTFLWMLALVEGSCQERTAWMNTFLPAAPPSCSSPCQRHASACSRSDGRGPGAWVTRRLPHPPLQPQRAARRALQVLPLAPVSSLPGRCRAAQLLSSPRPSAPHPAKPRRYGLPPPWLAGWLGVSVAGSTAATSCIQAHANRHPVRACLRPLAEGACVPAPADHVQPPARAVCCGGVEPAP